MSSAPTGPDIHELPAWGLPDDSIGLIALPGSWPERVDRGWAMEGSDGAGARVCIVDSGVEAGHPLVGNVRRSIAVRRGEDGSTQVGPDEHHDVAGHGTACASIIRSIAPAVAIDSVRVLGPDATGSSAALVAGLAWAVREGYDVINLSLSTSRKDVLVALHELADDAYFRRTMICASAHNLRVDSFPWRFASVLSVGSHERSDPLEFFYNPKPPVEFFARGTGLEVGWMGGGTIKTSGNSFATAHMAGICALILAKHPGLTPFQLKHVLYLISGNVGAPA